MKGINLICKCGNCNKRLLLSKRSYRTKKYCPYCGSFLHNDIECNNDKVSSWKLISFISRRINHIDIDTYTYKCENCGHITSHPTKVCDKCHCVMINCKD